MSERDSVKVEQVNFSMYCTFKDKCTVLCCYVSEEAYKRTVLAHSHGQYKVGVDCIVVVLQTRLVWPAAATAL